MSAYYACQSERAYALCSVTIILCSLDYSNATPSGLTIPSSSQLRLSITVYAICRCTTCLLPGAQPRLKSWGGPRFGFQHRGACSPRPVKAGLGVGCGRGSLPRAVRFQGYHPRKIFLKTQMLNPAFWWLLAVKFLAFWKLRSKSWRDQYNVGPQPKSWGDPSPPIPAVVAPMSVAILRQLHWVLPIPQRFQFKLAMFTPAACTMPLRSYPARDKISHTSSTGQLISLCALSRRGWTPAVQFELSRTLAGWALQTLVTDNKVCDCFESLESKVR